MRSFLFVAILFSPLVASQTTLAPVPSPGFPVCFVCGNATVAVGSPLTNASFPDGNSWVCGDVENGALAGFLNPAFCPIVQTTVKSQCNCTLKSVPTGAPTSIPVTAPTFAPVAPTLAPVQNPGFPVCFVCGNSSLVVGSPLTNATFADSRIRRCGDVENGGLAGFVYPDFCSSVQATVTSYCNCTLKRLPTSAPVTLTAAPVEPTLAPVAPTAVPVAPTRAPVATTLAPVAPTAVPTRVPVAPTPVPMAPTAAPVKPTPLPVAPTVVPVKPTAAPVTPTTAQIQPTAAPITPTGAPIKPTAVPFKPTAAPITPTAAPIKPTLAPVAPVLAPSEPTLVLSPKKTANASKNTFKLSYRRTGAGGNGGANSGR